MQYLENLFGHAFLDLATDEQAILATIYLEGEANHQRLKTLLPNHPADITKMLQHLIKQGMLISTGGRWAVYSLANDEILMEKALTPIHNNISNTDSLAGNELSLAGNELSLAGKIYQDLRIITELSVLPPELQQELITVASIAHNKKRLKPEVMQSLIYQLCKKHYLTSKVLSLLLNRNQRFLREDYLLPMVKEDKLTLAYPKQLTHENQAYHTTDKGLAYLAMLESEPQQNLLI